MPSSTATHRGIALELVGRRVQRPDLLEVDLTFGHDAPGEAGDRQAGEGAGQGERREPDPLRAQPGDLDLLVAIGAAAESRVGSNAAPPAAVGDVSWPAVVPVRGCPLGAPLTTAERCSSSPRSRAAWSAGSPSSLRIDLPLRSETPVPISTLARPRARCRKCDVTSTVRTRSSRAARVRRRNSPSRICSWSPLTRQRVVNHRLIDSPVTIAAAASPHSAPWPEPEPASSSTTRPGRARPSSLTGCTNSIRGLSRRHSTEVASADVGADTSAVIRSRPRCWPAPGWSARPRAGRRSRGPTRGS